MDQRHHASSSEDDDNAPLARAHGAACVHYPRPRLRVRAHHDGAYRLVLPALAFGCIVDMVSIVALGAQLLKFAHKPRLDRRRVIGIRFARVVIVGRHNECIGGTDSRVVRHHRKQKPTPSHALDEPLERKVAFLRHAWRAAVAVLATVAEVADGEFTRVTRRESWLITRRQLVEDAPQLDCRKVELEFLQAEKLELAEVDHPVGIVQRRNLRRSENIRGGRRRGSETDKQSEPSEPRPNPPHVHLVKHATQIVHADCSWIVRFLKLAGSPSRLGALLFEPRHHRPSVDC